MAEDGENSRLQYPLLDQPVPSAPPVNPIPESQQTVPCACPKTERFVLGLFVVLQALVIVAQLVTLFSRIWIHYCFWNFGLLAGENHSDHSDHTSHYDESGFIFSLQDDYCKGELLKEPISQYCPLFCINIWILGVNGIITLVIGLLSTVLSLYPLVLHISALMKPTISPLVHWLTLVPLSAWATGCFVFYMGTLSLYFDVPAKREEEDGPRNEVGCALWMALAVAFAQVLLFLYSLIFTRKSFERRS